MDVMAFLADKPATYADRFLDAVRARRSGDDAAVQASVEELIGFHAASTDDQHAVRALLNQLITDAAAMDHIDDMVVESYANFGPGSTGPQ